MTKKAICGAHANLLILAFYICIGLCIPLLVGCSDQSPAPPAPPIPEVEVITVTSQMIPDETDFIGQTEAFRPVEIRPQVSGIIKKISFTEGRNAKKKVTSYI